MSRAPSSKWLLLVAHLFTAPAWAGEVEWKLLYDQAEAHFQRGNFDQAELFARAALEEAESSLGAEHRTTEQSLAVLYGTVRSRGKLDEALPLVQRLIALRTRHYGPDDPSTALAIHGNAEIFLMQSKFTEAEKLQHRALVVFEKKLGPKHFNTAVALHNMGTIRLKQEKYKEAEKFLRRALAVKQEVFGPRHGSVAHTLNNLALALDAQGRDLEAARVRRRAEAIQQR